MHDGENIYISRVGGNFQTMSLGVLVVSLPLKRGKGSRRGERAGLRGRETKDADQKLKASRGRQTG